MAVAVLLMTSFDTRIHEPTQVDSDVSKQKECPGWPLIVLADPETIYCWPMSNIVLTKGTSTATIPGRAARRCSVSLYIEGDDKYK